MAFRMPRPTRRSGSSIPAFRKRIPADLRGKVTGRQVRIAFPAHGAEPECIVVATLGAAEVTFSLRTRDPRIATARSGIAEDHLQRLFASLRAVAEQGPVHLTQKQCVSIAGEWYRDLVGRLEDEPGSSRTWAGFRETFSPDVFLERNRPAAADGRYENRLSEADLLRFKMRPFIVEELAKRSIAEVDVETADKLAKAMWQALGGASETLERRANGDYGPDMVVQRFPPIGEASLPASRRTATSGEKGAGATSAGQGGAKATTFAALLTGWWMEAEAAGLSRRTHRAYASAMGRLAEHVGHTDAARITADDIIALKTARLAAGVSTKTVKDSDLAGLKAVFGWAVANRRLPENPAAGVTVKRIKPLRLREKAFTDKDTVALLTAASHHQRGRERPKTFAAKRWVPWLCAYTGARVGEIAQLRRQDVRQEGTEWVVTLTPEAGTVKAREAREVPLHPHLVEMGFPDFVAGSGDGHLFFTPNRKGDVLGPLKGLTDTLGEFAREVVTDPHVAPNHGWRHRFKTVGMEVGVSERVLDALCGHAPRSVGATYGTVTLAAKVAAVKMLPKYEVPDASTSPLWRDPTG